MRPLVVLRPRGSHSVLPLLHVQLELVVTRERHLTNRAFTFESGKTVSFLHMGLGVLCKFELASTNSTPGIKFIVL